MVKLAILGVVVLRAPYTMQKGEFDRQTPNALDRRVLARGMPKKDLIFLWLGDIL